MYGLAVTALPLLYGADYVCFGFGFGPARARTVYLSDYGTTGDRGAADEVEREEGIELLVLDALRWDESHPVHASALESIEVARRLRPQKTLLVGMGHTMEHGGERKRGTCWRWKDWTYSWPTMDSLYPSHSSRSVLRRQTSGPTPVGPRPA